MRIGAVYIETEAVYQKPIKNLKTSSQLNGNNLVTISLTPELGSKSLKTCTGVFHLLANVAEAFTTGKLMRS